MDTDEHGFQLSTFQLFLTLDSTSFPAHTRFMAKKVRCHANRFDGLDRCPSLAGAGEGGRRPGEGCWEKTNFRALGNVLYALTPTEIKIVEKSS